jgi:hypothetical protein
MIGFVLGQFRYNGFELSSAIYVIPFLSYDAKEYYHFSEVVDEFCKNGWTM